MPLKFNLDDERHLKAAEGWFALDLHLDANEELAKIDWNLNFVFYKDTYLKDCPRGAYCLQC